MFDFINFNNIVELFNSYFSSCFDNISLINIYYFIFNNKYILFFLLIIYFFILVDNTFKCINKLFIFVYICFFLLFVLLFKGNFFINEIFWYTLIINGAFIFHICICDWLYRIFIYLNWDYGCFLITRISFIFSLSNLIYLLNLIYIKINYYYEHSSYSEKTWFIIFIYNIKILVFIFMLILIFFISLFTNYSLLLKGIKVNKLNIKNIIHMFLFLLITMLISIIILGISRLYFIWIILIIIYISKILKIYNYKLLLTYFNLLDFFEYDFTNKVIIIDANYNEINAHWFSFGFIYYINYIKKITNSYQLIPKSPFKYYNKKIIILKYFRSYFNKIIKINNFISLKNYEKILSKAVLDFDFNEDDIKFFDKKLKKIYKNSIIS